jgi:hypothetical protein
MNEEESNVRNKFSEEEKRTILILDRVLQQKFVRNEINMIAKRVERELMKDSRSDLAWEPVLLEAYLADLPEIIRSSWVFAVRAGVNTGAERHPNSHQFMMSYKGTGDLQIWVEECWAPHLLTSDLSDPIENRWVSVPPNVWHRALGSEDNWIVVSFHTASTDELIEERPDPVDERRFSQRLYVDKPKIE